jgi:predicted nuclease with TOPRIM domain
MSQYEMPMEEEIKLLVKKVGSLGEKFDALDEKFDAIDKRFDAIDKKFDAVDKKFVAMDQKLDTKFGEVMIRLDETNAIAKLGLEGLQGLRESMDDKFEAAAKTSTDQTELLKAVLVHLRKRVDVLERPKPRRRRS